ncbi:ABC transporter ATP-binding protein [Micromonospora humi]|uniref:ABC-2 type transport system ATP-binding protein n=1 Tax=Micromonospora humi TaxID=745366 RepID=A0A1C5II95_9ACTN|nr:ABC transporter ATP-binding protein [Micromonospora humi]SCG58087.1 ABC-2 type transport system ATP-binding protein [Micromonospora humi]
MLELRQAGRRFGRRWVFAGFDLSLPAGHRALLTGPNGAGKTTVLRCLAGTLALSAGRATVAGHPVGTTAARRLTGVCLAPEQGLYEELSARENVALVARIRLGRRAAAAAVSRVEEELDIGGYATVPVSRCSAGMRSRVSIARALVGDPALLVLDEPDRSLDAHSRARLWEALDRRAGLTCVVVSHHRDRRDRGYREITLGAAG